MLILFLPIIHSDFFSISSCLIGTLQSFFESISNHVHTFVQIEIKSEMEISTQMHFQKLSDKQRTYTLNILEYNSSLKSRLILILSSLDFKTQQQLYNKKNQDGKYFIFVSVPH